MDKKGPFPQSLQHHCMTKEGVYLVKKEDGQKRRKGEKVGRERENKRSLLSV